MVECSAVSWVVLRVGKTAERKAFHLAADSAAQSAVLMAGK